jgi:AcrR family transcriptional regulator
MECIMLAAKPHQKGDHLRWGESMREDIEGGQARLIDAALFCYARFGPLHTRVIDVALQARVTRVTFYRYFRNSHDLLNATIKRELAQLWRSTVEQVPAHVHADNAPVAALLMLLNQLKQPEHHFLAHPDTLAALGAIMLDVDYLAQTALAITPLLPQHTPPAGALTMIFELMNRAMISYLNNPSPMFQTDEQLGELLSSTVAPIIASLLANTPDNTAFLQVAASATAPSHH